MQWTFIFIYCWWHYNLIVLENNLAICFKKNTDSINSLPESQRKHKKTAIIKYHILMIFILFICFNLKTWKDICIKIFYMAVYNYKIFI